MKPQNTPQTIDCHYVEPGFAASYLLRSKNDLAFVDNNTTQALPHLLNAIQKTGLTPQDVKYLIITHVHLDHAGGTGALLQHCQKAKVLCHPRAVKHLVDPSRLESSARQVYGHAVFEKLYGPKLIGISSSSIQELKDDEVISFGNRSLKFLHTRGHANHHICILDLENSDLFTGDSFGLCYPRLQERNKKRLIFPSTSPTDFDPEAAIETVTRIENLNPKTIYPTHFGPFDDVLEAAKDLKFHLAYSKTQLHLAAESIKKGLSMAETSKLILKNLTQFLKDWLKTYQRELTVEQWKMLNLDLKLNADGITYSASRLG